MKNIRIALIAFFLIVFNLIAKSQLHIYEMSGILCYIEKLNQVAIHDFSNFTSNKEFNEIFNQGMNKDSTIIIIQMNSGNCSSIIYSYDINSGTFTYFSNNSTKKQRIILNDSEKQSISRNLKLINSGFYHLGCQITSSLSTSRSILINLKRNKLFRIQL